MGESGRLIVGDAVKSEVQSGYKPAQDDALRTLGLAVIVGQGVEHLMSTCLTFPLHGEPLQTKEQMEGLLAKHSKATLGQMLKTVRQKVDLHPTFDEQLDRFLQNRNIIAHRLHDVPGGLDLHSDEGRARLKAFLTRYMEDGETLSMVFLGVLRAWTVEVGIDLPNEHHLSKRMKQHLDGLTPQLADLLRPKEPLAGQ